MERLPSLFSLFHNMDTLIFPPPGFIHVMPRALTHVGPPPPGRSFPVQLEKEPIEEWCVSLMTDPNVDDELLTDMIVTRMREARMNKYRFGAYQVEVMDQAEHLISISYLQQTRMFPEKYFGYRWEVFTVDESKTIV